MYTVVRRLVVSLQGRHETGSKTSGLGLVNHIKNKEGRDWGKEVVRCEEVMADGRKYNNHPSCLAAHLRDV